MRHLLLSHDFLPRIGGAHRWLYDVYSRWPRRVEALVEDLRFDGEGKAAEQQLFDRRSHGSLEIHRGDVRIENLSLFDLDCLRRVGSQRRWLIAAVADEPAVVHCLRAFPEGWAGAAFKAGGRGRRHLVIYAHGEELLVARTSRQLWLASRLILKMACLVIANSSFTRNAVESLCRDAVVRVIHPGVDVSSFKPDPDRIEMKRTSWGWPRETVKLVTLARMEPRKNHLAVLQAMKTLRDEGIGIGWVLGGDGEESDRLRVEVEQRGLGEWVRFCGPLGDEERALTMAAADIHIMPSVQLGPMTEGFGIVFLEAAAAGIPSIAGNVGGQPEAVKDGITGLVVDGLDVGRISNAIRVLARDVELRKRFGEAGLEWARRNDCRVVAENTYASISEVCGN